MTKKFVQITFELPSEFDDLPNDAIEHLFKYGYFVTDVHGSADRSPFWNAESYSSDNPILSNPETVELLEDYALCL
jgi:hypothetical protein